MMKEINPIKLGVDTSVPSEECFRRRSDGGNRPNDLAAEFSQHVLDLHEHKRLVFDLSTPRPR